jgi:AcrR family transcriptional regulator
MASPGTESAMRSTTKASTAPATQIPAPKRPRKDNAEATRLAILDAALEEFSRQGFGGARLETIASQAACAKRMIYYYFEHKEGLYLAVLERAYRDIRSSELALDLHALHPIEAIKQLAHATFDYHESHPAFTRLVALENIQEGKFITKMAMIEGVNQSAIRELVDILQRGQQLGIFRDDLNPVDLHMVISAFCAFRVDHRYTFSKLFGRDLMDAELRVHHKDLLVDTLMRLLRAQSSTN